MKKAFLTILVISSIASMQLNAEEIVNFKNNEYSSIDEKYAGKMNDFVLGDALSIEGYRYSKPENLYIAGLYFYGDKKNKNLSKAGKLFKDSAYENFIPAKYMLGKMILNGDSHIISKVEAVEMLKRIKGDSYYENKTFELLSESYLRDKDYNNAIIYLSKIKNKESLYKIAKIYEDKGDKNTAIMVYNEAIDMGSSLAKLQVARNLLHEDTLNTKKAIYLLEDVAENGKDVDSVSSAQTLLGDIYFYGNQEMYANHEKGLDFYKKASNNNHYEAMLKLHKIYIENEEDNKYRLGKNKFEIHDLGEKIRSELYDQ